MFQAKQSSQGKARWQDIFTSRITDSVKLVGSTISCEGSPKDGNVSAEWRTNPHVQSYIVATDKVASCLESLPVNVSCISKKAWRNLKQPLGLEILSISNAAHIVHHSEGKDWWKFACTCRLG